MRRNGHCRCITNTIFLAAAVKFPAPKKHVSAIMKGEAILLVTLHLLFSCAVQAFPRTAT